MRTKLLTAVIFVALTAPASAETCEALIMKVDRAIEESQASSEKKDQAMRLRDQGESQRAEGNFDQCQTPLMQALQMLGQ